MLPSSLLIRTRFLFLAKENNEATLWEGVTEDERDEFKKTLCDFVKQGVSCPNLLEMDVCPFSHHPHKLFNAAFYSGDKARILDQILENPHWEDLYNQIWILKYCDTVFQSRPFPEYRVAKETIFNELIKNNKFRHPKLIKKIDFDVLKAEFGEKSVFFEEGNLESRSSSLEGTQSPRGGFSNRDQLEQEAQASFDLFIKSRSLGWRDTVDKMQSENYSSKPLDDLPLLNAICEQLEVGDFDPVALNVDFREVEGVPQSHVQEFLVGKLFKPSFAKPIPCPQYRVQSIGENFLKVVFKPTLTLLIIFSGEIEMSISSDSSTISIQRIPEYMCFFDFRFLNYEVSTKLLDREYALLKRLELCAYINDMAEFNNLVEFYLVDGKRERLIEILDYTSRNFFDGKQYSPFFNMTAETYLYI